jgi:hypothetical protein
MEVYFLKRNNVYNVLLLILFFQIKLSANELKSSQIDSLRNLLYSGIERENALDSLNTFILELEAENNLGSLPILIAYKGVCKSAEAKYDFWPWDKLNSVNDGLGLLNKAVKLDSSNIEIRFLRFAVLHNIPSFLGYSKEAREDAECLYNLITNSENAEDKYLIEKVAEYLVKSERLDENQDYVLTRLYNLSLNK